jgi:hypothetical protein
MNNHQLKNPEKKYLCNLKERERVSQHTSPVGILVFCLTRAPAATMACFSTTTPSRSVAPMPTKASSSTVHPCKTAL